MPHVSEVAATSHDRHDPMLVAALAAGDLAGTDRDQAIALTRSCAECAALHADLVAIAPATDARAAADPRRRTATSGSRRSRPRASDGPAGDASCRPARPAASLTRPLGVALATFGIVGLLIGSLPLGFAFVRLGRSRPPGAARGREPERREPGVDDRRRRQQRRRRPLPAASAAAASEPPRSGASRRRGRTGAVPARPTAAEPTPAWRLRLGAHEGEAGSSPPRTSGSPGTASPRRRRPAQAHRARHGRRPRGTAGRVVVAAR